MRTYTFQDGTIILVDGYMDAERIKANEKEHGRLLTVQLGNQIVECNYDV